MIAPTSSPLAHQVLRVLEQRIKKRFPAYEGGVFPPEASLVDRGQKIILDLVVPWLGGEDEPKTRGWGMADGFGLSDEGLLGYSWGVLTSVVGVLLVAAVLARLLWRRGRRAEEAKVFHQEGRSSDGGSAGGNTGENAGNVLGVSSREAGMGSGRVGAGETVGRDKEQVCERGGQEGCVFKKTDGGEDHMVVGSPGPDMETGVHPLSVGYLGWTVVGRPAKPSKE